MKIIIVSGYFDPVHKGHIELFEKAKSLGDKLIVILNNDKQATIKKGRPFMSQEERKIILKSIKFIDEVFICIDKDKSVCESIRKIRDKYSDEELIFANGGDRFNYEIPEAKTCNELKIKIIDGLGEKIQSSSNLIK